MDVNCLLFNDFEALDLFGPVEVFGDIGEYSIKYFSMYGGPVACRQKAAVMTEPASDMKAGGILLVPGGRGSRTLVCDDCFTETLKCLAEKSEWRLTVCTGSALLAKTGLLDGRKATSNKAAFEWARSVGPRVNWQYAARWVRDGEYYTSSGVSAGTDMALGFVSDRLGREKAEETARLMEYVWNDDQTRDPFAV